MSDLTRLKLAEKFDEGLTEQDYIEIKKENETKSFSEKYMDFYDDVKHKISEDW